MDSVVKEFGLAFSLIIDSMAEPKDIVDKPKKLYGIFADMYPGRSYEHARRMVKKGFDSGVYASIYSAKDRQTEAGLCVYKLVCDEFMIEFHARQTVGIVLLALDNSVENLEFVEKFVGEEIKTEETVEQKTIEVEPKYEESLTKSNDEIETLLKRTFLFLEDKDWLNADVYAEKVLDKDPECSRAYVGKLMAELKLDKEILLGEASTPQISLKPNFKKACRYATAEELAVLKDYEYRNAYARGKKVMAKAKTEKNFKDASTWFKLYPTYKDSQKLYDECIAAAEEIRREEVYKSLSFLAGEDRLRALDSISGYKDADEQKKKALAEMQSQKIKEEKIKRKEKSSRSSAKIISIVIVILGLAIDFILTSKWKYESGWFRWIVLPLVALFCGLGASCLVFKRILGSASLYDFKKVFSKIVIFIYGAWSFIRALIISVAYFKIYSDNIWLPIITVLFLFVFNWIGAWLGLVFAEQAS